MKQLSAENQTVTLVPFGETAIMVEFGKGIHLDIHRKVTALIRYLDQYPFPGMVEYVAAYANVTVYFNPAVLASEQAISLLQNIVDKLRSESAAQSRIVEIPVCYGEQFGPDLEFVAEHNGLTSEEVIRIHSGGQYLVYMIGFAPGFPYLGGMSEKIATPRRQSPRPLIPAGTVGIAGIQTGMYPIPTPGGWQLIGRTPLALFRPHDNPPTLLQAGDIIQFRPISPAEYVDLGGAAQ